MTAVQDIFEGWDPELDGLLGAVRADESQRFKAGWKFTEGESYAYFKRLTDGDCRHQLMELFSATTRTRNAQPPYGNGFTWFLISGSCLAHFGRVKLDWGRSEVLRVLTETQSIAFDADFSIDQYRFAVGLAEQLHRRSQLDPELSGLLNSIDDNVHLASGAMQGLGDHVAHNAGVHHGSAGAVNSLTARLLTLLPAASQRDPYGGVKFTETEAYGNEALVAMQPFLGHRGLTDALPHLVKATGSASWKKETVRQQAAANVIRNVARALLLVLDHIDPRAIWSLAPSSLALIKGAAAVLGAVGDDFDALSLERTFEASAHLAEGMYSMGVPPRACLAALGELDVPEAQSALIRLQGKFRSGDLKKRIVAALDQVAARSGLTPGTLIERQIEELDLDQNSTKTAGNATVTAHLVVTVDGVKTTWLVGGVPTRSLSAQTKSDHAVQLAEIRAVVKELTSAFSAQRLRLEGLFAGERRWTHASWTTLYQQHRLVGPMARALLWQAHVNDTWTTFMGDTKPPSNASAIRLWHPLLVTSIEVNRWRDKVISARIAQPFKQIYREHYVLTPAEEESGVTSARFAGHSLRVDQIFALMKARGWQAKWMGVSAVVTTCHRNSCWPKDATGLLWTWTSMRKSMIAQLQDGSVLIKPMENPGAG